MAPGIIRFMWGAFEETAASPRRVSFGNREAAERFAAELPSWLAVPYEDPRCGSHCRRRWVMPATAGPATERRIVHDVPERCERPLVTQLGYDGDFLGLPLAMPTVADLVVELPYHHFTVLHRADRRLAAVTAVNIHGKLLVDVERTSDRWNLDTRIPTEDQAGPALYSNNHFDRGHLVRRRDPDWGQFAHAANADTFHYTNSAPQVDRFNQSSDLWAGLEDYLLQHAATYEQRLSVFTGPVLAPDDPVYREVRIPLRFWKIAAWLQGTSIAASAYLLDQTDLVRGVLATAQAAKAAKASAYRTFQVSVADVLSATGMHAATLLAGDVLPASSGVAAPAPIELTGFANIRLR